MAWIQTVSDEEATGSLAGFLARARIRAGKVFNIIRIQTLNPPVLTSGIDLYLRTMKGRSPLSRAQREMIAVVVSKTNACHY